MIWWPFDIQSVDSTETWNDGDGTITFNWLQQREVDESVNDQGLYPSTTDPWDIS
jgi:hypothetical protein